MTRSTSFLRSRFLAKTLMVGGLASCPLLLNSEITLAQSYSNYREMGCTFEGNQTPYVFAVTSWSGAPANSGVFVESILRRYEYPKGYVDVATQSDDGFGASGIISTIAISPVSTGYFEGETIQTSTFFPTLDRFRYRICLP